MAAGGGAMGALGVAAGGAAELAFGGDMAAPTVAADPVETKLTLHVPADAKVFLAGSETRQTGETRHYVTSQLTGGQTWNDYTVRVEVERNGQIVTDERTLSLVGGQSQELQIDLDAPKVAAK